MEKKTFRVRELFQGSKRLLSGRSIWNVVYQKVRMSGSSAMKPIHTIMRAGSRNLSRFINKLLWLLPIVCLIIVSCSTTPTPPQTQQCGTINPTTEGTTSAEHSGTCFWQAFQHCKAASLTYDNGKSTTYTLTITSDASQCQVRENITSTAGATKSSTATCSHLQAFRGGAGALILTDCSDNGNITIPVNPAIQ